MYKNKKTIINFLCSDSGSHDYAINYKEAKELGLNVELANESLNGLINEWYEIISGELELNNPYNPIFELAESKSKTYKYIRVIMDSIKYGREQFVSKGLLQKTMMMPGMPGQQISDNRSFEGWEKMLTNKIIYKTNFQSSTVNFTSNGSSSLPNTLFELMRTNVLIVDSKIYHNKDIEKEMFNLSSGNKKDRLFCVEF